MSCALRQAGSLGLNKEEPLRHGGHTTYTVNSGQESVQLVTAQKLAASKTQSSRNVPDRCKVTGPSTSHLYLGGAIPAGSVTVGRDAMGG